MVLINSETIRSYVGCRSWTKLAPIIIFILSSSCIPDISDFDKSQDAFIKMKRGKEQISTHFSRACCSCLHPSAISIITNRLTKVCWSCTWAKDQISLHTLVERVAAASTHQRLALPQSPNQSVLVLYHLYLSYYHTPKLVTDSF